MSSRKIVITPRGFAKCGVENAKIMEAAGFQVCYNDTGLAYSPEEFSSITQGAEGIIVGVELVDREYIDSHPELKAVVKFGVGTDNIDVAYCQKKGIFVGRTVGSNARSVAETAISFVIADSKNLFNSIANTREHGWAKMTGYEIQGKTIGIIGFGAIGREVAKMARGLGMNVMVFDTCPIPLELIEKFSLQVVSMDTIIESADFISLHIPLTPETKNIISTEELHRMKPNSVLINTARGGIVDEAALYDALKNGIIRSAYFDVFTCEPPREDEPLLTLRNFYLTPHSASRSAEAEKNTADIATRVILEALK